MSPISCEILSELSHKAETTAIITGGNPQETPVRSPLAEPEHNLPRDKWHSLQEGDIIHLPSGAKLEAKHWLYRDRGRYGSKFIIEDRSKRSGEIIVQFEKIAIEGIESHTSSPVLKIEVSETPESMQKKPVIIYNHGDEIAEITWRLKEE